MNYINNKNKIYKVVFSLIGFILMLSGVSYAYFVSKVNNNESTSTIAGEAANLELEFKEGSNQINGDDIFPGWSDTKTFTVKNKSSIDVYYNLYISDIKNELMSESISYKIESTDGGYNLEKVLLPSTDGIIKTGIYIKGNASHTYKITTYYNNLDIDQSSEKGKTFSFKIYVKGYVSGEQTTIAQNGGTIVLKNSLESDLGNYRIYGNTILSGSPSPDSPIKITSLGENNSKNLFNPDNLEQGAYIDATGFKSDARNRVRTINPITLEKGTYYMSLKNCDNIIIRAMYKYNLDNTFIQYNSIGSKFFDFTLSEDTNVKFSFINNNQEIVPEDLKFCQIQLEKGTSATSYEEYKGINLEIYKNLIENGYGEMGNNTNFTSLIYKTDTPLSTISGSFYREGNTSKTIESVNYTEIDPTKKYHYSFYAKNMGNLETSFLIGFKEYDTDKKWIESRNIMYVANTLTKLTKDLHSGDTVVYIDDLSNFRNVNGQYSSGLIFWNYCNSTGYCYEPETYSQNVYLNIFDFANVNTSDNTITLKSAWSGKTITAGTYLSQSNAGGNFHYTFANKLSSDWTKYEDVIEGEKSGFVSTEYFRTGAKYLKVAITDNRFAASTAKTYYAGFKLVEDGYEKQKTIKLNEPLRCVNSICDYIDYENKRVVRKIGKKIFTGDENWNKSSYPPDGAVQFYTDKIEGLTADLNSIVNSHFVSKRQKNGSSIGEYYNLYPATELNLSTATEFKSWLKSEYEEGTPVTVYYVKETVSTENINIKPISAYNDTTSISINDVNNISPSRIEIGYKKLNK